MAGFQTYDSCSYPMFRRMRAAVKDQAELMAVSYAERIDLTYGSDEEMEKAYLQYVSGWMFDSFGLRPALGPPAHRKRRSSRRARIPSRCSPTTIGRAASGRIRNVIGRTFRMGDDLYQIVGVGRRALHRHGDRHRHRHLRSHDDEKSADARQSHELLAPDVWSTEAGRCRRTRSREIARDVSRHPAGESQGLHGHVQTASGAILPGEAAAGTRRLRTFEPAERLPPVARWPWACWWCWCC